MKVVSYIESIIDMHQKEHGIYFHSIHREYIQDQVNKGIYAFQVIYVDDFGSLHLNSLNEINDLKLNYGCGIYTFVKN